MCPDNQILSAYIDGEVCKVQRSSIKKHIEICLTCRERVHRLTALTKRVKISGIDVTEFVKEIIWTRLVHSTSTSKNLGFWHKDFVLSPYLMLSMAYIVLAFIVTGLFWVVTDKQNTGYIINKTESTFGSEYFPIKVSIDHIENFLAYSDIHDDQLEVNIELPDLSFFVIQGEPRFLRKADYIVGR